MMRELTRFASLWSTEGYTTSMDGEEIEHIDRMQREVFERARDGTRHDVMTLGCPACGGPLMVFWMRQLIPYFGRDALNIRCADPECRMTICADGNFPRPEWASFFSGTLTTCANTIRPVRSGKT